MKRKLIILLILFVAITGKAQEKKHFTLFTDRDTYASGETLLLKVFAPTNEPSGVVKADLINSNGKIIVEISKKLINHQADGFIYLPDSLSSGFYLLGTSTRISSELTIKEIYISNRFTGVPESESAMGPKIINQLIGKTASELQTEGLNQRYKSRDKARITLHMPAELLAQIAGNLLISVAETTPGYSPATFTAGIQPPNDTIIEKDGVVLDGLIKDLKTGEPFKNGLIFLSIPDSIPRFDFFLTGEDGRFNFKLDNYYGKIPLVVQGFDKNEKRLLKIVVNHPETLRGGIPKFESRPVSPELRKNSEKNGEAVTFRKIFKQQEITIQPVQRPKADAYPFYGMATTVVNPNLFIDLPDFTEVSRELLTGVKFRAYNRIPTLQLFNSGQRSYFDGSPLLLIDGIPLRDLNVIKNLGSKDIKRVEICLSERHYGNLTFPGVLAIYTNKADYTRAVESDELVKLNLEGIQPEASLNTPLDQKANMPDLRRVLLWKPSVIPERSINLDFETSDILGSFKLTIRGTTRDGSVFYKEQSFEVN